MNTVILYLGYKKFQVKRRLARGILSLGKTRTWWHIYVGILVALLYLGHFYAAIISFGILLGITIRMDYVSGRHVKWERGRIEERARQQRETRIAPEGAPKFLIRKEENGEKSE